MVDCKPRKRFRALTIEAVEVEDNRPDMEDDTMSSMASWTDGDEPIQETEDCTTIKKELSGFCCPLTMEVMYDPVLDAEGNTFERAAVTEWLKEHRTSPVSRQPLSERMLKSNNSLRHAIHEVMGAKWVAEKTAEFGDIGSSAARIGNAMAAPVQHQQNLLSSTGSNNRDKMNNFLEFVSDRVGGLALKLNELGCCAFQYDGITVVMDVPVQVGVFCLYTRNLIPQGDLTNSMKDVILELNFLQGATRGGCLSVKKHENENTEVIFSYTDRVAEVCSQDVLNIILNFVGTASSLRAKLQSAIAPPSDPPTFISSSLRNVGLSSTTTSQRQVSSRTNNY